MTSAREDSDDVQTGFSRRTMLRGAAYVVPAATVLSLTAGTAEAASTPSPPAPPVPEDMGMNPSDSLDDTPDDGAVGGNSADADPSDPSGVLGTEATADGSALPFTGGEATTIALLGGAAVAAGTAAVVLGKRQADDA